MKFPYLTFGGERKFLRAIGGQTNFPKEGLFVPERGKFVCPPSVLLYFSLAISSRISRSLSLKSNLLL